MARSGQLRELITIQVGTPVEDELLGQSVSWAPLVSNIPARVEPVTGRERLAGGDGRISEVTHLVTMRYRTDVVATQRIVWGARTLQMTRVYDPTERKQWLACETVESEI